MFHLKAKVIFIFRICLFIAASFKVAANSPFVQNISTFDGLPSSAVYHVIQDSNRFIWFATDAGVSRYDGTSFVHFKKHDGLNSNSIIRIKEDSFGRIWFFNLNASLNFYYKGIIYNHKSAPFLEPIIGNQILTDFYEDDDQTLHFYSFLDRDIFHLDTLNHVSITQLSKEHFTLTNEKLNRGVVTIRQLYRFPDGDFAIWSGGGLYKTSHFDDHASHVFDFFRIRNVFMLPNDVVYIDAIEQGLLQFQYDIAEGTYVVDSIASAEINDSKLISSVFQDNYGNIWVSTFDKGVFCLQDGKTVKHFDIQKGQAVMQDHENNIWVTSIGNGVFRISPQVNRFAHFSPTNGTKKSIFTLAKHHNRGVWFAIDNSINLLRNDIIYPLVFPEIRGFVDQLIHLDADNLLVNELNLNSYMLEGVRLDENSGLAIVRNFRKTDMVPKRFVVNQNKTKVFAYMARNLFLLNKENLFDSLQIQTGERVYNGWYDSKDVLHIHTTKTYTYNNDRLEVCENMSQFDDKIITNHMILNDSIDLFVQDGDSIFLKSDTRLINLSRQLDFYVDMQIKHIDYSHPYLFIATGKNIFICDSPLGVFENKSLTLTPLDAFFRNIHQMLYHDGNIYIASDDGLSYIQFHGIEDFIGAAPIPYFQFIQINGDPKVYNQSSIRIRENDRVHIGFGSVNYSGNPSIYAYLLNGSDSDWVTGSGTSVIYQGLSPGSYELRLRAQKPTSGWSEAVSVSIVVVPLFYKHPLFIILATIFVGFLVFLLFVRKNKIELKKRSMEHQLVLLEQKALQSQMNPHFIFNTLGSIQSYMLQNKPEDAAQYLAKFAQLTRKTLSSSASSMISLQDEIDRLHIYLELEQLRMDNSFKYSIDIFNITNCKLISIPSMIVQPIVENAIWHGVSSIEGPRNIAIIFVYMEGDVVRITIEDNGVGMVQSRINQSDTDIHMNLGMMTTQKRLKLLGKKMQMTPSFTVEEVTPGAPEPGTRVNMVVPCTISPE